MKKIILLVFILLTALFSMAQKNKPKLEDYIPFIPLIKPHNHSSFHKIYSTIVRNDTDEQYITDKIPTKRVFTDSNGGFCLADSTKVSRINNDLSSYIDGRKTFYFKDIIYTPKDIITIRTEPYDLIEVGRYSPDEEVYSYAYCIRGSIINGKKDGLWEIYNGGYETDYNHIKIIDENYRDGLLHGVRLCYDQYGKMVSNEFFFNGTGTCLYHHPTGEVAVRGGLVQGKRHGTWGYFDKQGWVVRIEHYDAGLLHGDLIIGSCDGTVLCKTTFKNGTGQYREYTGDQLTLEGSMVNGRRVGKWTEFYKCRYPDFEIENRRVIEVRRWTKEYKEDDPINNPNCILDQTYFEGKWIYVLVLKD